MGGGRSIHFERHQRLVVWEGEAQDDREAVVLPHHVALRLLQHSVRGDKDQIRRFRWRYALRPRTMNTEKRSLVRSEIAE